MTTNDFDRPQYGERLEQTPEVYLRWEGQRFPLRSLGAQKFVVRCESMVRRHDPNQKASVMNGTLVSDFDGDVAILFRVDGTDGKFARCKLAALSDLKAQRLERLNSYWQAALSKAASARVETARRDAQAKRKAEDQRRQRAHLQSDPSSQIGDHSGSATPANGRGAQAHRKPRSKVKRYGLVGLISLTLGGLFLVKSADQGDQPTQTAKANESPATIAADAVEQRPYERAAFVRSDPRTNNSSQVRPSRVTNKTSADRPSRVPPSVLTRRLTQARNDLSDLQQQYDAAVAKHQNDAATDEQAKAAALADAESELAKAGKEVDEIVSLLRRLEPLIKEENIGTAEVEEIQQDLQQAKQDRDQQNATVVALRRAIALPVADGTKETIIELADKIQRLKSDIRQLEDGR